MSQANVETARRWLDAVAEEDVETASGLVDRDVVLVPPGGQPPYRGVDSMRRWMEPDAFEGQEVKEFEPVLAGGCRVLGRLHIRARGMTSGIELDVRSWAVWTFDDDGLITRIEIFLQHQEDEARAAADSLRR
ncbi:MAG TPA: nuclear transport factor 2 family protein [Solirubrobacterales bacterium]|nr:nuclear transport factor 2 family protein [Solirubrobacterales bacterium]